MKAMAARAAQSELLSESDALDQHIAEVRRLWHEVDSLKDKIICADPAQFDTMTGD